MFTNFSPSEGYRVMGQNVCTAVGVLWVFSGVIVRPSRVGGRCRLPS